LHTSARERERAGARVAAGAVVGAATGQHRDRHDADGEDSDAPEHARNLHSRACPPRSPSPT
jgi:hypothetical protein